jgi:hypothetical protein
MKETITFRLDRQVVTTGRVDTQGDDYVRDCRALSPVERLAVVQDLRECYWGDEAVTSRLSRLPDGVERRGR